MNLIDASTKKDVQYLFIAPLKIFWKGYISNKEIENGLGILHAAIHCLPKEQSQQIGKYYSDPQRKDMS